MGMNRLSSSSKHTMLTRVITALVLCVVAIPCLLLGGWYYFAAMIFMSVFAIFEMIQAPNKGRFNLWMYVVVFVFVDCMIYSPFFFSENLHASINNSHLIVINDISIPLIFMAAYVIILFAVSLFSVNITVTDVCYLFTMGVYIAFTFICMMFIRYLPNDTVYNGSDGIMSSLLACYVVLAATANDVGAYFVGVLLGKHKMCPRISPNKTWEGFFGGVTISFISSFVFAYVLHINGIELLGNILSWSPNWWRILLLSLAMPIAGVIGDLMFSLIKRTYAIKDFGNIFPGHGGVLDRIDSLSLICIVVAVIIEIFINGWAGLL